MKYKERILRVVVPLFSAGLLLMCTHFTYAADIRFDYKGEQTYVRHEKYHFLHRVYINQKPVELLDQKIMFNEGPDKEVISFFSAITHNDQSWWISEWDEPTRTEWDSQDDIGTQLHKMYRYYQRELRHRKLTFTDWVVLQDKVWIFVDLTDDAASGALHVVLPMVLEGGRWRVSYPEMNSRFIRH